MQTATQTAKPKLTPRFRAALKALKDQSSAVMAAFDARTPRRENARLVDAQKRMARYRPEVNAIMAALTRAAMVDSRITVPTVSEKDMAVLLGRPPAGDTRRRR